MNTKNLKSKKSILVLVACFSLGILIGASGMYLYFQVKPSPLFDFDSRIVKKITIRHSDQRIAIGEKDEIQKIIQLFNDFNYESTESLEPAMGWEYCADIESATGITWIFFEEDCVRIYQPDGSSVKYYSPGYFQNLIQSLTY
jgi:hypothetical protein